MNYKEAYEQVSIIPQQLDIAEVWRFANLVPDKQPFYVLDVGCAEGKLATELVRRGHGVTALDISETFLSQINDPRINKICGDIENPIQTDLVFDYVYMMDVIEHLISPLRALENIRKVLSSEGSLFIHTPNACSPERLKANFTSRNKIVSFKDEDIDALHLNSYDYQTLRNLCYFAGFKVKKIHNNSTFSKNLLFECTPSERAMDFGKWAEIWRKRVRSTPV